MKLGTVTMIAIAALTASTQLSSAAQRGNHMVTTGLTSQPIGHYNYCKQYISDCKIKTWNTKAPALTRQRWKDLVEVNSFSNKTVIPVTDQELYNIEEHWAFPAAYGDCEDYVLQKRQMLMDRGWPPSSLLITVVLQPNGEGHAVLTVRTDRADYVLDNLNDRILQWNQTEYTYLKRQSVRYSGHWSNIKDIKG